MLSGPGQPPPPNVIPNFVDPPDLEAVFIVTTTLTVFISSFLVLARLYTKKFIINRVTSDDYILLAGWLCFLLLNCFSCAFKYHGAGRDQWNVRLRDVIEVGKWFTAAASTYGSAIGLVKVSILVQLRHIFIPARKTDVMWWSTWVMSVVVLLFYTASTFWVIFMCSPVEKSWKPWLVGTCASTATNYMATGLFNVVSDVVICLIPQWTIWRLRLSLRKRLQTTAIFAIGGFACACSAVRIYYTIKLNTSSNVTKTGLQFGLWAVAEIAAALVCACLPTFPRFYQNTIMKSSLYSYVSTFTKQSVDSRLKSTLATKTGDSQKHSQYHRMNESGFSKGQTSTTPSQDDIELGSNLHDGIMRRVEISMTSETAAPVNEMRGEWR